MDRRHAAITSITRDNLHDLAVGATVFGTGGGGDPYIGVLMARQAIENHGPVKLITVDELPDDGLVLPVAVMGAPTVLVEKIAGALAEQGASLAEVKEMAEKVNANGRSMGMALTSCVVPAAGTPTFELGADEMEIGIGIHGEPGRRRVPLAPVDEIAEMLVEPIVADLGLKSGDSVLAFVNGMGGTPLIELYLVYHSVSRLLRGHGLSVARSLVGNYITSLEMAGFSVTLLRVDDELTRLWDAPVHTPALRWGI